MLKLQPYRIQTGSVFKLERIILNEKQITALISKMTFYGGYDLSLQSKRIPKTYQ